MNVLVTGGTGFIGSHVARQLLQAGESVVLYDYAPDRSRIADIKDDVTVVRGDVREAETMARTMTEQSVDCIVHLAAVLTTTARENPVMAVDVNALATARVLDLASTLGVDRAVVASSIAVYGFSDSTDEFHVTEGSPRRPSNLYGSCKVLSEDIGRTYARERDLGVTALRFGTAFGPRRTTGASTFTSDLVEEPFAGRPITVRGKNVRLNWLYVKDAARAVRRAVATGDEGYRVFNVYSDVGSMADAGAAVEAEIADADVTVREGLPGSIPGAWPIMDVSKARDELGFTPSYDLRDAVRDYVQELRA